MSNHFQKWLLRLFIDDTRGCHLRYSWNPSRVIDFVTRHPILVDDLLYNLICYQDFPFFRFWAFFFKNFLLWLAVVYNMSPIGGYLTILLQRTCNIHIDFLSIDLLLLVSAFKNRLDLYCICFDGIFASQAWARCVFFVVQRPIDCC